MQPMDHETPDHVMLAYSAQAASQTQWESDPTVWQRLDEWTPYGDESVDRMGQFSDPEFLEEFPTVAEAMMSLPRYEGMNPLFGRYLRAMVLSRDAQLAPGRVTVLLQDLGALPVQGQIAEGERLQVMADEVFDWMSAQGMDPFPGRTELPRLVTDQLRERLEASQA